MMKQLDNSIYNEADSEEIKVDDVWGITEEKINSNVSIREDDNIKYQTITVEDGELKTIKISGNVSVINMKGGEPTYYYNTSDGVGNREGASTTMIRNDGTIIIKKYDGYIGFMYYVDSGGTAHYIKIKITNWNDNYIILEVVENNYGLTSEWTIITL